MARHGYGRKGSRKHFLGHEKEPPSLNSKARGGKHPLVHSHSARPKRSIKSGGRKH